MGDLIGNDLESLVRSPSESGKEADEAAQASRSMEAPRPRVAPAPPTGRSHPRIFAVASGKGGTGKSLIAVNLAVALAERRKVCLIDADFGLGNAHILLGLFPRHNVSHLIRGEQGLDDVLHEGPRGLLLLPGACGVPEMASLDDSTLESFASTVAPVLDRCDVAILDCPAGITRQSLLLIHGADVVMVVTTNDLTSMTDAYALIKTLVTHRPEMTVGLLVNDARSPAEGAETYRKVCHVSRKFLGRELLSLGTIPSDSQLERSVMERRPLVVAHPRAAAARAIEDLAMRLVGLQGLEADLGLPERMHRTLAATGAAPGNGRHGEGLCMS
jgi:flagellar biosynthesis protein FlhG